MCVCAIVIVYEFLHYQLHVHMRSKLCYLWHLNLSLSWQVGLDHKAASKIMMNLITIISSVFDDSTIDIRESFKPPKVIFLDEARGLNPKSTHLLSQDAY